MVRSSVTSAKSGRISPESQRILLLCDMPPCKGWAGGIVLHQMCQMLGDRVAACYCVTPFVHDATPEPELNLPFMRRRGYSPGRRYFRNKTLQTATRSVLERTSVAKAERENLQEAIAWGKSHGVTAVWAVIEGATMIRLALPLAEGLGVPLTCQVWDPPRLWLRSHNYDARLQRNLFAQFDKTLGSSAVLMAASWNMADDYAQYGVPVVPVPACLDAAMTQTPATAVSNSETLTIGMAGQLYARDEWRCLLAALERRNWTIAGRRASVKFFGAVDAGPDEIGKPVQFCGWQAQPDVIRQLSQCDVLFCPYWFDPAFAEEARQGFPSKLTTYLAAGRPALYLGPGDASPARFLREANAGLICDALDPEQVAAGLEKLASDPQFYAQAARNGRAAFDEHLSTAAMGRRLDFVCERLSAAATPRAAIRLAA